MKGLILSFFAVLLAYSLFFDNNEEQTTKTDLKEYNSVYMIQPATIPIVDTVSVDNTYSTISYTDVLNVQNIL